MQDLEKTTENSERLGRQERPGIEPGTSRLPVLRAEPLGHWQINDGMLTIHTLRILFCD